MKKVLERIGIFFIWFYLICSILFNAIFITFKIDQPQDFGSFIQAGLYAAVGENPYRSDGDLLFRVVIDAVGLDVVNPNLNPPISVNIFEWIAQLGSAQMLSMACRLLSIVLYLVGILFLEKNYQTQKGKIRLVWALSLAGFWHTIELGQIYIPLVLLLCFAWVYMTQKKVVIAGILLGLLLAIKPNFFLLVLIILTGGYFRLAITSIITFAAVSILPLFRYGPEIYSQWLIASAAYDGYALPNNDSFVGLMVRFQHPEWGTWLSIALMTFLLILAWRKRIDPQLLWGFGVTASLLCSPIAWGGYTLFFLPYFYSRKDWLFAEKIAAALFTIVFIIPVYLFQLSFVNYILFGWTYGWGILLILFSQIKRAWKEPTLPAFSFLKQNKI